MELMMGMLKLKDHLTNAEMPESYTNPETVDAITPADRWDSDDATVKLYIATSLPTPTFMRIDGKSTAKECWDKLRETFGHKHLIGLDVTQLERGLFNKRCGEDEDVRSHFEKLLDLREQLASLGKGLSDNEFSYILITSFPASYDACIVSLDAMAKMTKNDLDPFHIIGTITYFYDRRMLRNSKSRAAQQQSSSSKTRRKARRGH
jgi:hypothetical protein